ncbi:MAG: ATP-binding protein [Candidatus Eremiobacteraeota bacterium]|nr:ATP-binding protein [Candidatus Eremiobacteraeota bacterium]
METGLITAVIGARQVGKTTMLLKLQELIAAKGPVAGAMIFYFTFDDPLLRAELYRDAKHLEREIERRTGMPFPGDKPVLIIIDEVQKVPLIFDWLKLVYDRHCENLRLVLSGSSSPELRLGSAESLAGRITFLRLFPLSLREIIKSAWGLALPPPLWDILGGTHPMKDFISRQSLLYSHKAELENLLERILLEGCLPAVYAADTPAEKLLRLQSMIETYLERDIRAMQEIGDLNSYVSVLKTISYEIGSLLNLSSLSSDLGIAYNTLKKYISILEDTFVLNILAPMVPRVRKRSVKSSKVYFFDVGIANMLVKRTEREHIHGPVGGFLFENIMLKSFEAENRNRLARKNCYFWRDYDGHEIDLVVSAGAHLFPVEIDYGKNLPREKLRNFKAFFEQFPESLYGIFLYRGELKEEQLGERKIFLIPWWLWW